MAYTPNARVLNAFAQLFKTTYPSPKPKTFKWKDSVDCPNSRPEEWKNRVKKKSS